MITSGASTTATVMSDKKVLIPKYARAGVAFAGVEIQDAFILLGGVVIGFIAGAFLNCGMKVYVGGPVVCYLANTWYLDWKEQSPPGHLRAILFRLGLMGYSDAFPAADMVYIGDSNALNPASHELIAKPLNPDAAQGEH